MMRDLSSTIARLGGDNFIVKRRVPGEFIEGRYVRPEGADTEFSAKGSIQVMNPRELEMLPEGQRTSSSRKLYTTCELRVGGVDQKEPDHIMFREIEYEVQQVGDWQHNGNYFKYLLVKAGQ